MSAGNDPSLLQAVEGVLGGDRRLNRRLLESRQIQMNAQEGVASIRRRTRPTQIFSCYAQILIITARRVGVSVIQHMHTSPVQCGMANMIPLHFREPRSFGFVLISHVSFYMSKPNVLPAIATFTKMLLRKQH